MVASIAAYVLCKNIFERFDVVPGRSDCRSDFRGASRGK